VVLLERDGTLDAVASAGEEWSDDELRELVPLPGVPVSVGIGSSDSVRAVALAATGSPVGILGIRGPALALAERELLRTFTNTVALVVERARLREQALRTEMLEETERVRKSLMGAVSHDLRTPLATIKLSASTLRERGTALDGHDREELLGAIESQTDRLSRLVTNLLDMTRVQSGALRVSRQPVSVPDLVDDALSALQVAPGSARLSISLPGNLPPVDVDHVLMGQVIVNLAENALRFSPEASRVTIEALRRADGRVELRVADCGPGIAEADRLDVFELFHRAGPGEGTGVGLAIAKAFVEAHDQQIWVEPRPEGGAVFALTLPVAGPEV